MTPSSPTVLRKILSIWPQSSAEWKAPFRLLSQFGSLDPLNLGAEWQLTHSNGSGRRLVGPLHEIIHVPANSNEKVEEPRSRMSAQFPVSAFGS